MAKEEVKKETVNETEEVKEQTEGKEEEKKDPKENLDEVPVSIPDEELGIIRVSPRVAKFFKRARKAAKVAIPVVCGLGGVALGIAGGKEIEKRRLQPELDSARAQIGNLQMQLEERRDPVIPSLPGPAPEVTVPDGVIDIPMGVIE